MAAMEGPMAVVETETFLASAARVGIGETERADSSVRARHLCQEPEGQPIRRRKKAARKTVAAIIAEHSRRK
jgi:hypothetical protein